VAYIWVAAVLAAVLLLIGAAFLFVRIVEKKRGKEIGMLYVDPSEPDEGEGVYCAFYHGQDPKAFTDGESVILTVKVIRK
jgi:hypothetical protein